MTQQANSYNIFVLILAIYSLKLNSWVVKKKKKESKFQIKEHNRVESPYVP